MTADMSQAASGEMSVIPVQPKNIYEVTSTPDMSQFASADAPSKLTADGVKSNIDCTLVTADMSQVDIGPKSPPGQSPMTPSTARQAATAALS